jgi:hypothetical protein
MVFKPTVSASKRSRATPQAARALEPAVVSVNNAASGNRTGMLSFKTPLECQCTIEISFQSCSSVFLLHYPIS